MNILTKILTEEIFREDNKFKPHEKLIIDAVIAFMKNELSFNPARIVVKKKRSQRFIGDVPMSHTSVIEDKFIVHYNPDQGFGQRIKTLIHELTHVKQISKKELRPSEDWKGILWKDEDKLSVREYKKKMKNFEEYKKLGWEEEAYDNMKRLYDKFLKSSYWTDLKGQDATLDYIMDNVEYI